MCAKLLKVNIGECGLISSFKNEFFTKTTIMSQPPDPYYILRGTGSPLSSLKFQTNDVLLAGDHAGFVNIWCLETNRVEHKLPAHPGFSVIWIDCIATTGSLLTQGRDGTLKIWNQSDADWIVNGEIKVNAMGFCGGCLTDMNTAAVPSEVQSQVNIVDLRTHKVSHQLQPDADVQKFGMCMQIKPVSKSDENKLLIGYENGCVALWDIRQTKKSACEKLHEECLMSLCYSPKLSRGYSGSVNNTLKTWSLGDDGIHVTDTATIVNPGVNNCVVRNDGKIVVFGGWDGRVRVFGAKRMKPLAVLQYHKESVHCLTFSDSNLLACGSKDQQITLWNIYK